MNFFGHCHHKPCGRWFRTYRSPKNVAKHGEPKYCGRQCAARAREGWTA